MSDNTELFKAAWQTLSETQTRLIVSHEDPDGDAVCSVLAAARLLSGLKGRTEIFLPGAPAEYAYLPGFNLIKNICPKEFDAVLALDYGGWSRTGLGNAVPEKNIITLDHHPKRGQRGAVQIIDVSASSTCELIYEWARALKFPVDQNLAFILITGIMTDTGNLQYSSTSSRTLEIVEQLVLAGAPLSKITRRLNDLNSTAVLKAWAKLLSEATVDNELNVVYMLLPLARLKALGLKPEQCSGFASFLATVPGPRAAAFLREDSPGVIQGSLRSDGPDALDVSVIAEKMGGGGHQRASGFTFQGSLESAWASLRLAFREVLGDTD